MRNCNYYSLAMTEKNCFHINTQKLSEIINYVYACLPPAQILFTCQLSKVSRRHYSRIEKHIECTYFYGSSPN
jgi:hypothetical protein